jgi:ribosomal protein S21
VSEPASCGILRHPVRCREAERYEKPGVKRKKKILAAKKRVFRKIRRTV